MSGLPTDKVAYTDSNRAGEVIDGERTRIGENTSRSCHNQGRSQSENSGCKCQKISTCISDGNFGMTDFCMEMSLYRGV